MDTLLPLVILILIAIGPAYYVLAPFVSDEEAAVGEDEATRTTALELRKVNLYKQIREVEFEREMGLVGQEDFDRTRADLLAEVTQVMRQLEGALAEQVPPVGPAPAPAEELVCPGCGTLIGPGARFCSSCGTAVGKVCPSCGTPVQSDDRFCASCGRGLLN